MYLGGSFGRKLCRSWDWFRSGSLLFADATSLRKIIALQFLVRGFGGTREGNIFFCSSWIWKIEKFHEMDRDTINLEWRIFQSMAKRIRNFYDK